MHRHADQTPKNPKATGRKATHSVEHAVSSQQSGVESAFPWVDNRSEAVAQRKLKKMANSSLQVQASGPLHRMEDTHFSTKSPPIQKKENKTGLPDSLKSGIENLSGFTMDDVRVHYNSSKPAQLQAHAYAQGTDIHLASGQEKHLPHEAWHVVQQKQGRVKPTMQMKEKVNINDDAGLEKEADLMGLKAFQNQSIVPNSSLQNASFPKTTAQRYLVPENEVDGSFTSQVSREKEGGGKTFLNQLGTGAQLESKTSSKVRVAVTGKMAIEDSDKGARQAKFFYADSDILNEANQAMAKINSPISFEEGTQVITVQDQEGNDHQLSLIIPVKHAGTENQETGTNIKIPENCNEAACAITNLGGGGQNRFKGKYKPGSETINPPSGYLGLELVGRLASFLPAYLKVKEYEESSGFSKFFQSEPTQENDWMNVTRSESLQSRDQITGYRDGLSPSKLKASEEDMKDRIGGYYTSEFLKKPNSKDIIDQLGINESAAPDAGDAMAIFSIGKAIGDVSGDFSVMDYRTGKMINKPAPYHFATVIAKSGADYITMENYVRRNEEGDDHAPADLDPRYFFRMYGPEAQSFHSENVSRYPNAMTLAFNKPVQQVTQLKSNDPIQFNPEEESAREVLAYMPDGPGNLTSSSEEAKKRFHRATRLEQMLLKTNNSVNNSPENQDMKELARDALYRQEHMTEEGDNQMSVSSHVGKEGKLNQPINGEKFRGLLRKEKLDYIKELIEINENFGNLIEIVWRDFVLKKTGGGSCDHISASTFLSLVEKGKEPVLISYEPQTDNEYEINPPNEKLNKHRSVLVQEGNLRKEVDPWFPKENKVNLFESAEDAKTKLINATLIWQWRPDDKEFVTAVQNELEIRYQMLQKENELNDEGNAEAIKALWEIKKIEH